MDLDTDTKPSANIKCTAQHILSYHLIKVPWLGIFSELQMKNGWRSGCLGPCPPLGPGIPGWPSQPGVPSHPFIPLTPGNPFIPCRPCRINISRKSMYLRKYWVHKQCKKKFDCHSLQSSPKGHRYSLTTL